MKYSTSRDGYTTLITEYTFANLATVLLPHWSSCSSLTTNLSSKLQLILFQPTIHSAFLRAYLVTDQSSVAGIIMERILFENIRTLIIC